MYDLITATSMGVRITPLDRQPVGIGNTFVMQSTSAESNVLNVSASLGLPYHLVTGDVEDFNKPVHRRTEQGASRRERVGEDACLSVPILVEDRPEGFLDQGDLILCVRLRRELNGFARETDSALSRVQGQFGH